MNDKIEVVIVEDDRELRNLLEQLIDKQEDMKVTKTFSNGRSFINEFKALDVDVVIMDINMPVVDGIEATRRLNRELPHISVIGLSVDNNKQMEEMMRKAGAASFLTKDTAIEKIHETILEVLQSPIE